MHTTARAIACGYIWPDALVDLEEASRPPSYAPPAALASFLTDADLSIPRLPPVLVTFGTMVSLGALGPSLDAAAQVLAAAFGFDGGIGEEEGGPSTTLRQQGVRVIMDAAGDPAWAEALRRAFQRSQGRFIVEEPVPHSWLLRKCR